MPQWVTVLHGLKALEIETVQSGIPFSPYPLDLETGYVYFFREGTYCRIRENLIGKYPDEFEIIKPAEVANLEDKFLYFIHFGGGIARFPKARKDKLYSILEKLDENERKSIFLTHYNSKYSSYIEEFGPEFKRKLEDERKRIRLEDERKKKNYLEKAKKHEKLLEFEEAVKIYKEYEMDDDIIRVREEARNKVEQTVVHGDQVTKTEIKDSVLNRSNVGVGGDDKFTKLKELTEMKEKGFIDDDEFKQMKKEILGK